MTLSYALGNLLLPNTKIVDVLKDVSNTISNKLF